MYKCFNYTCQGESHKATNKVCQDYSYSSISKDGLAVAIVCDGHGGDRYFRSDVGAKFATEITRESVITFVNSIDKSLFIGKAFTSEECADTKPKVNKQNPIDKVFRQLFSSIIYQWNNKITEHASSTTVSEWEQNNVEPRYLDALKNASALEKIYGCTLMAYVQTPDYWFAFHLGDGKCFSFHEDIIWKQPIPWDERCFLNKTTSICDSNAINEFRYCYQGDGQYPIAIFLGSDGMDDSFGEDENLVNFYIQILKTLVTDGFKATKQSIKETLPQLSKIGSKDDMSVAFVYDSTKLKSFFSDLISHQISVVKKDLKNQSERVSALQDKLVVLEESDLPNDKKEIEINYAKQSISKCQSERKKLLLKYDVLMKQLTNALVDKSSRKRNE